MTDATTGTPGNLIIIRGLPGAGKTTRARRYVAESPLTRIRSNRDDMRDMAFGSAIARIGASGERRHEDAITDAQHGQIRAWLRGGWEVVVDDTNLVPEHSRALASLAIGAGAGLEMWDLTYIDVETCIDNDAVRAAMGERFVGGEVIRDKYRRWLDRLISDTRYDLTAAVLDIRHRSEDMLDNGWETWKDDDHHRVMIQHASKVLVDDEVRRLAEQVASTGRRVHVGLDLFDSLSGLPGRDDLGGSGILADLLGAGFEHLTYRQVDMNAIPGGRP